MKRVTLDAAPENVRRFLRELPLADEGVELELNGSVICEVLPPHTVTSSHREALIRHARRLAIRARERNKGTPVRVLEREVQEALDEVRRRKQR